MAGSSYVFYIIFALLPSIIWLAFFLTKDRHPEPKRVIMKVFVWGMAFAIVVALFEVSILKAIDFIFPSLDPDALWLLLFKFLFVVALTEEVAKYLVVRQAAMFDSAVDEPMDIMLYFIVCALGFATIENLLLMIYLVDPFGIMSGLEFSFLRFVGATLLHTLTSGAFGFFVALSFYYKKNKGLLFFAGLLTAVLVHGFYNISIIWFSGIYQIVVPAIFLLALLILTSLGFVKLRRLKGVCRI